MAPRHFESGESKSDDDENEQGPVYLGELKKMLDSLVKYSVNDEVVEGAKSLLALLAVQCSITGEGE